MSATEEVTAVTGYRDKIVQHAKDLAIAYKGSHYKSGGKDTSAFDCSYFVCLVMKKVFPAYQYLNTSGIASSSLFTKSSSGAPGDIIMFPVGTVPYAAKKGDKKSYPAHVGIVLDASSWVGRQSSSLGVVLFTNPWWGSRSVEYYTYNAIDAAVSRANGSSLRRHFA